MTAQRPRLLFLGQTLPYPPDGGVHIRMYNILRLLGGEFDITALCFYRREERPTPAEVAEGVAGLSSVARVEAFPIPQEHSRRRWFKDHLRSLREGRAYTWFTYSSDQVYRRIAALRREMTFDLAHIDSLDLAAYLPALDGLPVVCTHHNVESALLRRRAATTTGGLRRRYLGHQADLLERLEKEWCERVALNVCVSAQDVAHLRRLAPRGRYTVVPNGADPETDVRTEVVPEEGVLGVGGLNWGPNREGLDLLCQEILPHLRMLRPGVSVRWVGRASNEEQLRYGTRYGVVLTGYVTDIRPHLAGAACVIAPLRSGGGTRLKILDAWAMGKAVVATTIGCEGLDAVDGENILIRDDPAAFAAAVEQVLQDPELRRRLGDGARRTVERTYAWNVIGAPMLATYHSLAGRDAEQLVAVT